jgi:hypothetical protein
MKSTENRGRDDMIKKEDLYRDFPFAELRASDGSARIRIYTYKYQYPEANNKDDADWYMNYISLHINGVAAQIDEPIIEGRVLAFLLKEIIEFKDLKTKEVDFSFTEPEFSFDLFNKMLSDKNILVSGQMMDNKLDRSNVNIRFEFITDLSLIENFINGIELILKKFPSRY